MSTDSVLGGRRRVSGKACRCDDEQKDEKLNCQGGEEHDGEAEAEAALVAELGGDGEVGEEGCGGEQQEATDPEEDRSESAGPGAGAGDEADGSDDEVGGQKTKVKNCCRVGRGGHRREYGRGRVGRQKECVTRA